MPPLPPRIRFDFGSRPGLTAQQSRPIKSTSTGSSSKVLFVLFIMSKLFT